MPDPAPSSSRLEDLRMRWQLDPASRVYLQLAEEYRKLDRHPEAIEVLKRGLQQRPNDLSGQVALGRCHLEMDELEPALKLLEAVIERDPAHMVGNKLLLEAYLKSGEATLAGERLDLYKLLNPADPDIETSEMQLRSLRARGVPDPGGATTAQIPIVPRGEEEALELEELAADDVFELAIEPDSAFELAIEPDSAFELAIEPDSAFELASEPDSAFELAIEPDSAFEPLATGPEVEDEPTRPVLEPVDEELEPAPPARDPAFDTSPAFSLAHLAGLKADEEQEDAAAAAVEEPPLIDEALLDETPIGATPIGLPEEPAAGTADAEAELPALADHELFYLGPPPPPPRIEELWGWPARPPVMASPPAAEPRLEEPLAAEEPEEEASPFAAEELLAAPEPIVPEPIAPEEEPATATLGALYLRQGHVAEAEKIFRQVLRRDPRNAAALAGLARIRGEKGLTAQALLASAGEQIPVGLTAKKLRLLESYMKHLRKTGEAHVH